MAALAAAVVGALAISGPVDARVVWSIAPSLTVAAVHDDNIFLTTEPAVEDDIVRYTPGIAIDYTADELNVVATYSQDAEYYNDNDQLDSSSIRRSGLVVMTYQASERLTWGLNASYFKTPTPGELNLGDGLIQLGRTPTTRESAGATVDYAFTPTLDGAFAYTATRDETQLGIGGDTHEARSEFQKDLSARNSVLFGYTYRLFRFNNANEQDSHTAMLGWEHLFTPRTTLRIMAGPRFFGDDVEPNIESSLRHEFSTGEFTLVYNRSEVLLAGSATRVESELASFVYTQRIGNRFTFSVAPALGQTRSPLGADVEVRQIGADARYAFNDYISVSASWLGSRQEENIVGGFERKIPRDIATVALNFTYPLRGERE
ncbi:MAG: hypothetical protein ACO1PZ_11745 [Gammaproteobacteria bacterium]